MQRIHLLALASLALGALVGCPSVEAPPQRNIVVVGSRGMLPLVSEIAARFEANHPGVRINLDPGHADRAIGDTRTGLADVGLLGRSLRPEETGLVGHVLARDGIAFVVHRGNSVPPLSETHLVGVLTRVYTTWKDVGGDNRPIVVIGAGEGRALRDVVLEHFGLRSQQMRPDPALGGSSQVLQAVAGQPGAIGYVSLGKAEVFARKEGVRLLTFHGITATTENVRTGTYPLVRNLLLVTRGTAQGPVKEFLDFALSTDVHDLVLKHGFVPVTP